MNGFEKRAKLIKQKIMKTTLDMLRTWEPKKIRIADIAKLANVSQVTIYNYFGSKEALLREVLKDYVDRSIQQFEEYMRGDHSFKEKIQFMILQEQQSYQTLSPHIIKELVLDDLEIYQYVEDQKNKRAIPLFIQLINDGKEAGEISPRVSIQTIFTYIGLYMSQAKELYDAAEQSGDPKGFFDELMHVFFYGICGKE
ncbi:TetR/AcrR family transcriptional regulator [Paenibacillus sediminis]|uniref:AcrR family transcriptional regulator n=1 Tax=Paenibacillus sediminis TaxID=664909 RepID=A0ABS4H3I3_9BACL|nr:TetR/AcrR family transcriptional regulator [Paenibacillus sediminis]MBP1937031.1 AcrR family transcriptional regulator [Paenibacillus sediminis]